MSSVGSPIQDYVHPDDQTQPFEMTPGFKPFTVLYINIRLQNSPYFCVFKYARAVKQKVWNEAENSRGWRA